MGPPGTGRKVIIEHILIFPFKEIFFDCSDPPKRDTVSHRSPALQLP